MPQGGNRMGSRFMVSHNEVLLNDVESMAQALNDAGRWTDQEFVEDAEGFGMNCL